MERVKIVDIPAAHRKIKLRTCPFCGGDDFELIRYGTTKNIPYVYSLYCDTCGTEGPSRLSISEAITSWNIRAGDPKE